MQRLIALLALCATPALAQDPPQDATGPDLERINQAFFHQYDGNRDGLVTRREFLTPSMAQFDYLDRNGDGMVDMREVAAFTRMMTEQRPPQPRPQPQPQP